MKKIDPSLIIVLVSLLVIAGGFAVSQLTSLLQPMHLWISFVVIAAFTSLSIFLGLAYLKPSIKNAVEDQKTQVVEAVQTAVDSMELKFSSFENRIDVFQVFQDPDWVITTSELVDRESVLPKKEVWIVSSYLGGELDDDLFAPVIAANTQRGVVYHYVIPNDHQARSKIKTIRDMVSDSSKVLAIQIDDGLPASRQSAPRERAAPPLGSSASQ